MTTATSLTDIKERIIPILRRHGVLRAGIFGSFARGEEREDSDIDILIDVARGTTLFGLSALALELEDTLGLKVDLVTYPAIHPQLRESILSDQVVVF